MNDTSVAQAYFLIAVNDQGKFPTQNLDSSVCLVAGGVLDMILSESVKFDQKRLAVIGELTPENTHLASLYEYIQHQRKPFPVDKLVTAYCASFTDRLLKKLISDVGQSLVALDAATPTVGGFLIRTERFIPKAEAVDHIIQNIRAEVLEQGHLSDEMIALISLMEKSKQIKKYFSKYENDQLKQRLQEIRQTESNQLVKQMIDYINAMLTLIIAAAT